MTGTSYKIATPNDAATEGHIFVGNLTVRRRVGKDLQTRARSEVLASS